VLLPSHLPILKKSNLSAAWILPVKMALPILWLAFVEPISNVNFGDVLAIFRN